MAHTTNVTCLCHLEVTDANEYEALEEVIKMIEKKYELSKTVTLTVKETITTTTLGCGESEIKAIEEGKKEWICKHCGQSTFDVDYDYLCAQDEHLECALIHESKSEQKKAK